MNLGCFHDVVGVRVGVHCLSILNENGVEHLIRVKPPSKSEPILVQGEFGDFTKVKSGHRLQGLEPEDITEISIKVDYVDDNFHTRLLSIKSASGSCLTWELYCK